MKSGVKCGLEEEEFVSAAAQLSNARSEENLAYESWKWTLAARYQEANITYQGGIFQNGQIKRQNV